MNAFRTKLTLKNDLSEIRRVSDAIDELARRQHLSDEAKHDINMALEEAIANIIHHGFDDEEEHAIEVEIECGARKLVVRIEDDGVPFDPLEAEPTNTELSVNERPVGGLGIHLMRNFVDGMDYRREGGKNILTLTKKLADV